MKTAIDNLMKNDVFNVLVSAVLAYTVMTAVIIAILQVPSDVILDSGLTEIILVFEDYPDGNSYE